MKINSLEIRNFRSLGSLTLANPGRINLLVGKNNSGKTSVLESLRVLSSGGAIRTLLELAVEREDQVLGESAEDDRSIKHAISGIFTDHAIDSKEIRIGDFSGSISLSLKRVQYLYVKDEGSDVIATGRRQVLTTEEAKKFETSESEELDVREGLDVSLSGRQAELVRIDRVVSRILLDSAMEPKSALAACAYVPARPNDVDELASLWDQIALTDREEEVVNALRLIEPSIAGLTFVEASSDMEDVRRRLQRHPRVGAVRSSGRRIPVVKLDGSNLRVPLKSMGDGLHRILDVVLRLVAIQDGFLLLDEFENGLHFSIHDKLWELVLKIATERSVQVFATTHSDDCVQAFSRVSLGSDESGVLYRIARPSVDEGSHFVRRYSEQSLLDAEEAGVEVR
jgi:AAA domain, putative AbiEii toxin, Type IV TA system